MRITVCDYCGKRVHDSKVSVWGGKDVCDESKCAAQAFEDETCEKAREAAEKDKFRRYREP